MLQDAKRISVIVPVYNVEKFLPRCIDSILKQTYKNIEIILVDDGSKDNSGDICDKYASEDNRIIVVHQKNRGLSEARNVGMRLSSGEYVFFVDSDDWIEPRTLELLANVMNAHDVNIVECSYRCIYKDFIKYESECDGNIYVATASEAIEDNLKWGRFKPVAWNKLYKRDIMKDIYFPAGKYHEDEFTTYKYYYAASKIAFLDFSLYNYNCARLDSITAKFSEKNFDACEAFREKVHFILSKKELKKNLKSVGNAYYYVLFDSLSKGKKNKISFAAMRPTIKNALKDKEIAVRCNVDDVYKKYLKLLAISPSRCIKEWEKNNG